MEGRGPLYSIRIVVTSVSQKVKNGGYGRRMIRSVTILNMTQNCHNHEKGKVFYAPKKTKPLPTGIGCQSLCTRKKKKKESTEHPPSLPKAHPLSPGLQGRQCAFVFQSVGNWLGQEPEVRDLHGRESCGVLSRSAGWRLLTGGLRPGWRHPEPTGQGEQCACCKGGVLACFLQRAPARDLGSFPTPVSHPAP